MPSKLISTVPHAAQIDHTIPRSPAAQPPESIPDTATLTPFPGSSKGDRELALAYAGEATTRNRRRWAMLALPLLQAALAAHPDDAASADQLAQIYDRMGRTKDACDLFAKAANAAPGALVNLGTCQASGGDLEAAIKSWSAALEQNPGFEPARLNLAVAQFRSGNAEAARASLAAALRFDPFSRRALDLLQALPPEPRNKGGGTLRGNGRP
jgi:tetratricopeptide (TPR) repeat protein